LSNKTLPTPFVLGIIYAFASWMVPLVKIPLVGDINLFRAGFNYSHSLSILFIVLFSYLSFLLFKQRTKDSCILSSYIFISTAGVFGHYQYSLLELESSFNGIGSSSESALLSGIIQGLSHKVSSLFSLTWGAAFLPIGALFLAIVLYKNFQKDDGVYKITYLILSVAAIFTLYFYYNQYGDTFGLSNKNSGDISSLKSSNTIGKFQKKKSDNLALKDAFSKSYKKNIKIYSVEAKYTESLLKGKVPGLSFKIKNIGNKTVDSLKVTVKFLDAASQAISEEAFYPLSSSSPLKSGFIWRQKRGRFFAAESVPSEWAVGKVKLEISNIEVSDDKEEYFDNKTHKEHLNYIKNYIKIYDVSARYRNSLLDGKVPGIMFKVKNKGTRNISDLSVRFQFLDSKGKAIHEAVVAPVRSKSLFNNSPPLKANYIWQNDKNKFFSAPSVPEEWQEGSVKIKVVDLEFQEIQQ